MFVRYIPNHNDQADYIDCYQKLNSFAKKQKGSLECVRAGNTFKNLKNILRSSCASVIVNKISHISSYLQDIKDSFPFGQERKLKLLSMDDGYIFDQTDFAETFSVEICSHLILQSIRRFLNRLKKDGAQLDRLFGAKVKSKSGNSSAKILQIYGFAVPRWKMTRRLDVNRVLVYMFARKCEISFARGDK